MLHLLGVLLNFSPIKSEKKHKKVKSEICDSGSKVTYKALKKLKKVIMANISGKNSTIRNLEIIFIKSLLLGTS